MSKEEEEIKVSTIPKQEDINKLNRAASEFEQGVREYVENNPFYADELEKQEKKSLYQFPETGLFESNMDLPVYEEPSYWKSIRKKENLPSPKIRFFNSSPVYQKAPVNGKNGYFGWNPGTLIKGAQDKNWTQNNANNINNYINDTIGLTTSEQRWWEGIQEQNRAIAQMQNPSARKRAYNDLMEDIAFYTFEYVSKMTEKDWEELSKLPTAFLFLENFSEVAEAKGADFGSMYIASGDWRSGADRRVDLSNPSLTPYDIEQLHSNPVPQLILTALKILQADAETGGGAYLGSKIKGGALPFLAEVITEMFTGRAIISGGAKAVKMTQKGTKLYQQLRNSTLVQKLDNIPGFKSKNHKAALKNAAEVLVGSTAVKGAAVPLAGTDVIDDEWSAKEAALFTGIETTLTYALSRPLGWMVERVKPAKVAKVLANYKKGSLDKVTWDEIEQFRLMYQVINSTETKFLPKTGLKFLEDGKPLYSIIEASSHQSKKLAQNINSMSDNQLKAVIRNNDELLEFVNKTLEPVNSAKVNFKELSSKDISKLRTRWNKEINSVNHINKPLVDNTVDLIEELSTKYGKTLSGITATTAKIIKPFVKFRKGTDSVISVNIKGIDEILTKIEAGVKGVAKLGKQNIGRATRDASGFNTAELMVAARFLLAEQLDITVGKLSKLARQKRMTGEKFVEKVTNANSEFSKILPYMQRYLNLQTDIAQALRAMELSPHDIKVFMKANKMSPSDDAFRFLNIRGIQSTLTDVEKAILKNKSFKMDETGRIIGGAAHTGDDIAKFIRSKLDDTKKLRNKFDVNNGRGKLLDRWFLTGIYRAPWEILKATLLATVVRTVESAAGLTIAMHQKLAHSISYTLRGKFGAAANELNLAIDIANIGALLKRMSNPKYREASRKVAERQGFFTGITHYLQRFPVSRHHRFSHLVDEHGNVMNALGYDALIHPNLQKAISDLELKISNWVRGKVPLLGREEFRSILKRVNLDLLDGNSFRRVWNDLTELFQLLPRMIPIINDVALEGSAVPTAIRRTALKVDSDLKANKIFLNPSAKEKFLYELQLITEALLTREVTKKQIVKFDDAVLKAVDGDLQKMGQVIDIANNAWQKNFKDISSLTYKNPLSDRGHILNLMGKLDDFARQYPTLSTFNFAGFIRTTTNITATGLDMLVPLRLELGKVGNFFNQRGGRTLSGKLLDTQGNVIGKQVSDATELMGKVLIGSGLWSFGLHLCKNGTIEYDYDRKRANLKIGTDIYDMTQNNPNLQQVWDYTALIYDNYELYKLARNYMSVTEQKEYELVFDAGLETGADLFQHIFYSHFRGMLDNRLQYDTDDDGERMAAFILSFGILPHDPLIELFDYIREAHLGQDIKDWQLYSAHRNILDSISTKNQTLLNFLEEKGLKEKTPQARNPDGTKKTGRFNFFLGKSVDDQVGEPYQNIARHLKVNLRPNIPKEITVESENKEILKPFQLPNSLYGEVADQLQNLPNGIDYTEQMNMLVESDIFQQFYKAGNLKKCSTMIKDLHNTLWKFAYNLTLNKPRTDEMPKEMESIYNTKINNKPLVKRTFNSKGEQVWKWLEFITGKEAQVVLIQEEQRKKINRNNK